MNIPYKTAEWRLFIDSSKFSLKAILQNNGNVLPSIPVVYAVDVKETYENMKEILRYLEYDRFGWQICGDFKVIAILLGLQKGYTKFCCFLCEWDSRARDLHYKKKDWPVRSSYTPGMKSVSSQSLVDPTKILLPPLHIKLGLIKNFVKTLHKDGPAFQYLCRKFSRLSLEKIREGDLHWATGASSAA